MKRVFVIAEAGVNHNGEMSLAKELVKAAKQAGADAVKFQSFTAESLVSKSAPKAEYQKQTTSAHESQFSMLKKLELSQEQQLEVADYAKSVGIEFMSSPFDIGSLKFLVEKVGVKRIKLGSGEITNAPLLFEAAKSPVPVILSTGMSDLSDIREALGVFAFAFKAQSMKPSRENFRTAFETVASSELSEKLTLLHCVSEYPAPVNQMNLKAMLTMSHAFAIPIGLSDHTEGTAVSFAAVAMGARVIEKHFTLDRQMSGPDHRASLDARQMEALVSGIRDIEVAMGSGNKEPQPSETKNRELIRKSLYTTRAVKQGEVFSAENLAAKRPGKGISPFHYWDYMGRQASKELAEDEQV